MVRCSNDNIGNDYKKPNVIVVGILEMMKPLASHDRSWHDELYATIGTSKPSTIQNKIANNNNPTSTSFPPSSSFTSFVAQSLFKNQGSNNKPLNEAQVTP
jgi:hypothetical protein